MLTDLTIKKFLERLASGEPVPGGGSAAALSGALAASLSEMVARLTLNKADNAALEEKMSTLIDQASSLRAKLTGDVDKDSDAYARVMDAFHLPKGSEAEKTARATAIQEAMKEAARVPLSVAESGVALLKLAGVAVSEGNSSAITDGLVAVLMARSSVIGALYNVRINLVSINDRAFRDEMAHQTAVLEQEAAEAEGNILSAAAAALMKQHKGAS
jgi:methenyltetrahydrofolate cyclohydrolase